MDITQLRQQIDQVDAQLVELFRRRMDISSQIADYKKEQDMPIFDPAREREKLADVAGRVEPELESSVKVLYSLLFELSRSYQSVKNGGQTAVFSKILDSMEATPKLFPAQAVIACRGADEQRLTRMCSRIIKSPTVISFDASEAVCAAVEQGLCRYGLLPVENAAVYELLRSRDLYIVRSFRVSDPQGRMSRFVLCSKDLEIYPGADKTTLIMTLDNQPGSLYRVLARLYTLGVNVAKIDSDPLSSDDLQMKFYFDLESSVYSQEFVHLMCDLKDLCRDFRYLGSYTEVV